MKLRKLFGFLLFIGAILFCTATFELTAQDEGGEEAAAESVEGGEEAAAEEGGEEAAPAASGEQTFFDIVFGGNAMDIAVWFLIFLTSLATIALIIDSFLSIRVSKIMPQELVDAVKTALDEGDLGAAVEACESTPGPLSNILLAGFNNISEGYDVILDAVGSAASIETEKLMQRVNYLNLCGQLAPMFGLMGTVTGMVAAFAGLATASGASKAAKLAQSISGALYTTAVGLFIAIPAILGFTFVKNNASKIILTMEALTYDMIKTLKGAEVEEE